LAGDGRVTHAAGLFQHLMTLDADDTVKQWNLADLAVRPK
jgi:hypothetical protein